MIARVKKWFETIRIRRVIRSVVVAQIGEKLAKANWERVCKIARDRAANIAKGEPIDSQLILAGWDARWLATAAQAKARMLVVAGQNKKAGYNASPRRAVEIERITGVPADFTCPNTKFNRDDKGRVLSWESAASCRSGCP